MIFKINIVSLHRGMKRLAPMVLFCIGSVNSHAQYKAVSPFNTIGDCHRNAVPSYRGTTENEGMDEDADESNLVNLPKDSLKNNMPTVALPLKRIQVSSWFGARRDPMNRKSRRMHNGLDLKARFEEVFSMLPGIVTKATSSVNGGYYVTVNHGILVCSYLHLSKIKVTVGQHVGAGDVIAISGNSGKRTTGPHLHISCRWGGENGKFFNPLLVLGFVSEQLLNNKAKRQ